VNKVGVAALPGRHRANTGYTHVTHR